MIDLAKKLGVQSYCFRGFKTNEEVIEKLKACDLSTIELYGAHGQFEDESKWDEVTALYRDSGVDIAAIGVMGLANDEEKERKYFEFCKRAGAKYMSVNFSLGAVPECYRTAEKLADEYDVKLAIHNHGGRHWLGSGEMLRHVFANTSERVGLCLDTAWALDSREDPVAMVEQFKDRLYGLHVKDFVFDRCRQPEDVVAGTGALDLQGVTDALKKIDFDGYAVLEYEGDVDNPVPALQKCVESVRQTV